ncbi:MAG: type II toxin-antitoxin system death-on-curing family toxin [Alphaproteobacteria bacterium]|nr:type II toxin-antitoxin system death-on-curing family toxin [Alphaproteobacteria bacterium]
MNIPTTFEPVWVREDTALAIHQRQLAEHGGPGGVRDMGLLQSALARPQHMFHYRPDISLAELAAAYGFGIAKNHAFVDGNKRSALALTDLFLMLNGFEIIASAEENYRAIIALAEGTGGEEAYAAWLKKTIAPRA